MSSVGKVRRAYAAIAPRLGLSTKLPVFLTAQHDGSRHLEVGADGLMTLITTERGNEYERLTTADIDELLYWMFRDLISDRSWTYELRNRAPDQDSRRIAFAKASEEMGLLSPQWKWRFDEEIRQTLLKSPYHDGLAPSRAPDI